jgi:hypothetical protein
VFAAVCCAVTLMFSAACGSEPRLVQISKQWYIDELPPGRTAHRLYFDQGNGPVLVDREVERYFVWARGVCIMYQAARPEGSVIFSVAGRLTPIAITTTDRLRPWRLDTTALRRFDEPSEVEQRTMLAMEQIDYSDICLAAQLQAPREEKWAQSVRVDPTRFKVLESVLDVHGGDTVGNSTLSEAVRLGQVEVVDELIRVGADVNSANKYGGTVLMTAIAYRNPDIIHRLIRAGASLDAQDSDGQTALMRTAHYRNPEAAKILLDAGATATIRDRYGMTALARVPDGDGAAVQELRTLFQRAEASAR